MNVMIGVIAFVSGAIIGSFLNCVIYRLENNESFVKGRSYCPHCKHPLQWLDLIPVVSFLWLGRRCRYCKKSISYQYPLVEIVTGLVFLQVINYQFSIFNQFEIYQFLNLAFLLYIASVLIAIFVYDLRHYLIPDNVLFPAIIIAFLYRVPGDLLNYLLAAGIASGFFLAIFLVSKGKWMGFGDVKLAVLLGLLLGFPNILVALFLAFAFGAIIGVGAMTLHKKSLKSELPFAPFLILGTGMAFFWGSQATSWYFSLFLL